LIYIARPRSYERLAGDGIYHTNKNPVINPSLFSFAFACAVNIDSLGQRRRQGGKEAELEANADEDRRQERLLATTSRPQEALSQSQADRAVSTALVG
jgi:hypothetical protein